MESNKKIRIAHLINYLAPAGKEIGILKLLHHSDQAIFDNTLIVLNKTHTSEVLDLNNITLLQLNQGEGNNIKLPIQLSKLFKQHRFDIVHTHSWGTLIEGIAGAKLAGVPVIIHGEHGTFPQKIPHRYIQPYFWGMANRVLSVSGHLGKKLSTVTGFPLDKIEVILNGVEEANFYPSQKIRRNFRREFNFSENDFVVGAVGRLTGVKNQAMLLRAAREVIRRGEEIQIVLVGGFAVGDDKEAELKLLVSESGISEYVHFVGFQKNINLFYNGFDVFALTSLSEGCSNVIQEAMFCKKPVIATNVGGNPELIRDNHTGFLVESNNHIQLAERILALKHNTQLRKDIGLKARQFARKHFSLTQMVDAYHRVYLEEYDHALIKHPKFRTRRRTPVRTGRLKHLL